MEISRLLYDEAQFREELALMMNLRQTDRSKPVGKDILRLGMGSEDMGNNLSQVLDMELAQIINEVHSWCSSSLARSSLDFSSARSEHQDTSDSSDVDLFMRIYGARGAVASRADKSRRQISMRLQTDLALLWRTLSVLRFVGMPGVQKSFFCRFFENLKKFPALSLSSSWSGEGAKLEESEGDSAIIDSNADDGNNCEHRDIEADEGAPSSGQMYDIMSGRGVPGYLAGEGSRRNRNVGPSGRLGIEGGPTDGTGAAAYDYDGASGVGDATRQFSKSNNISGSAAPSKAEEGSNTRKDKDILYLPELQYLGNAQEDVGDPSVIDVRHDPLGVVQKLLDSAESCTFSTSPEERGPLLSTCLALAIKSGRLSLLAQVASVLFSEQGNAAKDMRLDLLEDIRDYLADMESTVASSCGASASDGDHECVPLLSSASESISDFAEVHEMAFNAPSSISRSRNEEVAATRGPSGVDSFISDALITRIDKGGILMSFGKADHGKLGHGDSQLHRLVPTVIETLQDVPVVKVVSMSTCVIAIDQKGTTYVWGTGSSTSSLSFMRSEMRPLRLEALPVKQPVRDLSCGLGHALFLLESGTVYSWGNGGNGRLGVGDLVDRGQATHVSALPNEWKVCAVQCGASHSMALLTNGDLYSWGKNTQGQCGISHCEENVLWPARVKHLGPSDEEHEQDTYAPKNIVVQVAAGWEHSAALTREGRVFMWGCGYKDSRRGVIPPVLGLGHNECKSSPQVITSLEGVTVRKVACGWDHCLALDEDGKLLSWGSGQNGKLGTGNEENVAIPTFVPAVEDRRFLHISAGCEHSAAIGDDGVLYTWGHGDGGRLGHGDNSQCVLPVPVVPLQISGVRPFGVHCGDKFTIVLAVDKPDPWKVTTPRQKMHEVTQSEYMMHVHNRYDKMASVAADDNQAQEISSVDRRQVAEILLSLLARCSSVNTKKRRQSKIVGSSSVSSQRVSPMEVDMPYSTECSIQTFGSLLSLLQLLIGPQLAAAFETQRLSATRDPNIHSDEGASGNNSLAIHDEEPNLEDSISLEDSLRLEDSLTFENSVSSFVTPAAKPHRAALGACQTESADEVEDLGVECVVDVIGPILCTFELLRDNLRCLQDVVNSHKATAESTCQAEKERQKQKYMTNQQDPVSKEYGAHDQLSADHPRFLDQTLDCDSDDGDGSNDTGTRLEENSYTDEPGPMDVEVKERDLCGPTGIDVKGELGPLDRAGSSDVSSPAAGPGSASVAVEGSHVVRAAGGGMPHSDSIGGEELSIDESAALDESMNGFLEQSFASQLLESTHDQSAMGGVSSAASNGEEKGYSRSAALRLGEADRGQQDDVQGGPDGPQVLQNAKEAPSPETLTRRGLFSDQYLSSDEESETRQDLWETTQDLGDLELQRAILSSMEMPSNKDEGLLIFDRYRNCVNEVDLTFPRISNIVEGLASKCFKYLSGALKSSQNTSMQDQMSALWLGLQRTMSVGFSVLREDRDQEAFLTAIVKDPVDYMYCLPGVVQNLLENAKMSKSGVPGKLHGLGSVGSSVTEADICTFFAFVKAITAGGDESLMLVKQLPPEVQDSLRSAAVSLVRILVTVVVVRIHSGVGEAARNKDRKVRAVVSDDPFIATFLSNLSDSICHEIESLSRTATSLSEHDLSRTLTGAVLPILASAMARCDTAESVAVYHEHALRYLELYHEVMSRGPQAATLQSWLRDKVRWLLLFSASAIRCLLEPHSSFSSGFSPYELRGVYAGALHGTRGDALAGQLFNNQSIIGSLESDALAWLRLSYSCAGTDPPEKAVSDFPCDILNEASLEASPSFNSYDTLVRAAFLEACKAPDLSVLPSWVRQSGLAVACLADAFAITSFPGNVSPPSEKEARVARKFRCAMLVLVMKSQIKNLPGVVDAAVSPAGISQSSAEASMQMAAWLSGVLVSSAMLSVPDWQERPLEQQVTLRLRYLLSTELASFPLVVSSSAILEMLRQQKGGTVGASSQGSRDAVSAGIDHGLSELGSLLSRCALAWRGGPVDGENNASRPLEVLLGSAESRQGGGNAHGQLQFYCSLAGFCFGSAAVESLERRFLFEYASFRNALSAVSLLERVLLLLSDDVASQIVLAKYLQLKCGFSLESSPSPGDHGDRLPNINVTMQRILSADSSFLDWHGSGASSSPFISSSMMQINEAVVRLDMRLLENLQSQGADQLLRSVPAFLLTQRTVMCALVQSLSSLTSRRCVFSLFEQPLKTSTHAVGLLVQRLNATSASDGETGRQSSVIGRQKMVEIDILRHTLLLLGPSPQELVGVMNLLALDRLPPECLRASSVSQHSNVLSSLVRCVTPMSLHYAEHFERFHKVVTAVQDVGASMVSPQLKLLEKTSPSMISNVFTPHGDYVLGFWLQVPSSVLKQAQDGQKRKIHVLSRVPETGDFNLVSMFSDASSSCDCNPSVSLVLEGEVASLLVTVTVFQESVVDDGSQGNPPPRSWNKRRMHISSGRLPLDSWVHCKITTAVVPDGDTTGDQSPSGEEKGGSGAGLERTAVTLCLDDVQVQRVVAEGARSPLHQNIVLGTIPSNFERNELSRELIAGDVYWLPFADGRGADADEIPFVEPPSLLLASLGMLMTTTHHLLKAISGCLLVCHFGAPVAGGGSGPVPSSVLMVVPTICKFALEAICLGDEELQYVAFGTLRTLLTLFPVLEESGSVSPVPGDAIKASVAVASTPDRGPLTSNPSPSPDLGSPTLPVGSAVKAAHMNKASKSLKNVLRDLMRLSDDLASSAPSTAAATTTDPDPNPLLTECSPVCIKVWRARVALLQRSDREKSLCAEWSSRLSLDPNSFLTGVSGAVACSLRRNSSEAQLLLAPLESPMSSPLPRGDEGSRKAPSPSSTMLFPPIAGAFSEGEDGPGPGPGPGTGTGAGAGAALPEGRTLCAALCGGGWPSSPSANRFVVAQPSPIYGYFEDGDGEERCLFGDGSRVVHASMRFGLLLHHDPGTFSAKVESEEGDAGGNLKVPKAGSVTVMPVSRLMPLSLPFKTVAMASLTGHPLSPVPRFEELVARFKSATTSAAKAGNENSPEKSRSVDGQHRGSSFPGALSTDPDDPALDPEGDLSPSSRAQRKRGPSLMSSMSTLRFLLCQLNELSSLQGQDGSEQLRRLCAVLPAELPSIVDLAGNSATNSVQTVCEESMSSISLLTALKNVLEEGDTVFLERVAAECWRHFDGQGSPRFRSVASRPAKGQTPPELQMKAISGEVQVADNKVRALTHFPSLKLGGTAMTYRSGRWFYEVSLLSDGLMQIGWADAQFHCDPVCGQGVGDHVHSWAIDGLRVKKWNVSCESYGKRWRLGDVVGVLVDMDLMEMRFYLNGEDLGSAFSNFKAVSLFPAISLNVRQSARVNFGQYKFIYPPHEADGKLFRPVCEAVASAAEDGQTPLKKRGASLSGLVTDSKEEDYSVPGAAVLQTPSRVAQADELSTALERSLLTNDERRSNPANFPAQPDDEGGDGNEDDHYSRLLEGEGEGEEEDGAATEAEVQRDANAAEMYNAAAGGSASASASAGGADAPVDLSEGAEAGRGSEFLVDDGEAGAGAEAGGRGGASEAETAAVEAAGGDVGAQSMRREVGDEEDEEEEQEEQEEEKDDDAGEDSGQNWDPTRFAQAQGDAARRALLAVQDGADNSQLADELRRQTLIENLISMGFPIDWALRGAEHCDASASESSVIAWIIERMELEQSRLDEYDGDNSRIIGGEEQEQEDAEELSLEYILSRHNFGAAGQGTEQGGRGAMGQEEGSSAEGRAGMLAASGLGVSGGGPGASRGADGASQETKSGILAAIHSLTSAESDQSSLEFYRGPDEGSWRTDEQYLSVLVGQAASGPRELEQHELLSQVFQSDPGDHAGRVSASIVAAAQFALCVQYARSICTAVTGLVSSEGETPDDQARGLLAVLLSKDSSASLIKCLEITFSRSAGYVGSFPVVTPVLDGVHLPAFQPLSPKHSTSLFESLWWLERALGMAPRGPCGEALLLVPQNTERFLQCLLGLAGGHTDKGAIVDGGDGGGSGLAAASRTLLEGLVADGVKCIDTASNDDYHSWDWIFDCHEMLVKGSRSMCSVLQKGRRLAPAERASSQLPVLWSYFTLRTLLCAAGSDSSSRHDLTRHHLRSVCSAETFNQLLKSCLCRNASLKMCIFDLCSLILARLHAQIDRQEAAPETASSTLALDSQLQNAAEYYLSVSKERRLLQALGARLRSEKLYRKLASSYTRALCGFLLQWQTLRRILGLFVDSHVHDFASVDWKPPRAVRAQETEGKDVVKVTEVTCSSMSVYWSVPTMLQARPQTSASFMNGEKRLGLFIAVVSSMGMEKPLLLLSTDSEEGTYKVGFLGPDTLYKLFVQRLDTVDGHAGALADGRESVVQDATNVDGACAKSLHEKEEAVVSAEEADDASITSSISFEKPGTASSPSPSTSSKQVLAGAGGGAGKPLSEAPLPMETSTYASTIGEPLFLLDPQNVCGNLEIGKMNLSLRNRVNKKWSTARADVKMTSGVHRWCVHIDRCISKNIFIGVVTADARLDNYAGCDQHGWAFLANKAVWHSKGKLRAYGDLYRSGDKVGVSLDLDAGTLSFSLNGKNLGVAVEGLHGPLYPAFSLYNEDDQLSIVPQKPSDARVSSATGASSVWSSYANSGERMLNRLDVVAGMQRHLLDGYSLVAMTEPGEAAACQKNLKLKSSAFAANAALKELEKRWVLWDEGISVRSFVCDDGYVSIVVSEEHCRSVCNPGMGSTPPQETEAEPFAPSPGKRVELEGQAHIVIGAASHRIWLQKVTTGEICGYTAATLSSQLGFELLPSVRPSRPKSSSAAGEARVPRMSVANLHEAVECQQRDWTLAEDEALSVWLQTIANTLGVQAVNLTAKQVEEALGTLKGDSAWLPARYRFLLDKAAGGVLLRACTLIHLNDYLQPLLPVICPDGCDNPPNHPTTLLKPLRSLVFGDIKAPFIASLSSSFTGKRGHRLPILDSMSDAHGAPAGIPLDVGAAAGGTADVSSMAVAEESGDVAVASKPGGAAGLSSVLPKANTKFPDSERSVQAGGGKKEGETPVVLRLRPQEEVAAELLAKAQQGVQRGMLSPQWRLVIGFQCSFVGQLFALLERLGAREEADNDGDGDRDAEKRASWDDFLRCTCSSRILVPAAAGAKGTHQPSPATTPFVVRPKESGSDGTETASKASPSRVFRLLSMLGDKHPPSDWHLFCAFIEEALDQAQALVDSLFGAHKEVLEPAQLTVIVQYFRAVGTLLGLGWRASASTTLRLPPHFTALLTDDGGGDGGGGSADAMDILDYQERSFAGALSAGLRSVVPGGALDILSGQEMAFLLRGSPTRVGVNGLRHRAQYMNGAKATDLHLVVFWAAIAEIPDSAYLAIIRAVFPSAANAAATDATLSLPLVAEEEERESSEQLTLRLYPPTALAMLCPDSSPMAVFPDKHGISLPKYSSLHVVKERLLAFVTSLSVNPSSTQ